ncbi:MAG TPA: hypothetical protein VGN41_24805 [Streptosporangiaceae bacterium]
MHAAVLERPGHPPVVVTGREPPVAGPGEVVVDVVAAPITPLDLLCASGTSYFGVPRTPYVPGVQGIGTVREALVWFPTTAGMGDGDGSMAARAAAPRAGSSRCPPGAWTRQAAGAANGRIVLTP